MGYTKLFDSMWSGSLYGKFEASAVFMVLLSLSDADGQVDMTHEAIAGRTGWPLDFIKEGIRQLEQPDERSRTEDAQGRRIIRLVESSSWGWFITNHAKYRDEMRSVERREYLREAKRKERDRRRQQMSTSQPPSTAVNPSYAYAYAATDQIIPEKKAATPPALKERKKVSRETEDPDWFLDFKLAYPDRAGDQKWRAALGQARTRISEGHLPREFVAGAERYAAYLRATGDFGGKFVKLAATFLGPEKSFLLPWTPPPEPESDWDKMERLNGGTDHGSGRVFENAESGGAALEASVRLVRSG